MKRKSVIITGIIAVAVIGIVAVVLFMKDAPISAGKGKKSGKASDVEPDAEPETEPEAEKTE